MITMGQESNTYCLEALGKGFLPSKEESQEEGHLSSSLLPRADRMPRTIITIVPQT